MSSRCTVRHRDRRRVVELALVNGQRAPARRPTRRRLYQVGPDRDRAGRAPRRSSSGTTTRICAEPPPRTTTSGCTWRCCTGEQREYAHGRQCAVDAEVRDGETRAWRLRTTCFPAAEVQLVVPATKDAGLVLDMARLGSPELARDELVRALRPLVDRVPDVARPQQARPARDDPEIARYAGRRAAAGRGHATSPTGSSGRSTCCATNGIAREAFRFANQAMALQRVRSEVVRARLAEPDADWTRCCASTTCRRTAAGGRSSSRSCCCACPG